MSTHKPLPAGITATHVRDALRALDRGVPYPHGAPTRWLLEHDGKQYPPKAVIGVASFFAFGWPLATQEFASGEEPHQAVGYLRRLGFTVVPKV